MDWYSELATYEALGLDYDKVAKLYKVNRLQSSTYLLNPLVSNYENIVVSKLDNVKLYDVKTTLMDDGKVKLFGRVYGSITPYVRIMTKEEIEENYIIITKSATDIKNMITQRNASKSK